MQYYLKKMKNIYEENEIVCVGSGLGGGGGGVENINDICVMIYAETMVSIDKEKWKNM